MRYRHRVRPHARTPFHGGVAFMLNLVRVTLGGERLHNLIKELSAPLEQLADTYGRTLRVLDYGCGNMEISRALLSTNRIASLVAADTYANPETGGHEYVQLTPGTPLPFAGQHFDVAMVVDVLHHAGIGQTAAILADIGRCASHVVVKDHLEFGFVSRQLLRLADWYGNWADGVAIPARYFTRDAWQQTVRQSGLTQVSFVTPVRIHHGIFGLIIPPRYHFIAVLQSAGKNA